MISGSEDLAMLLRECGAVAGAWHGRTAALHFGNVTAECLALAEGAAVVDLSGRTQIEIRGDDRVVFLHNMCTNDIRKLPDGGGCEAMLLSAKGHTLAHVFIFRGEDSIIVDTVPGQGPLLMAHLDRYIIREKVELVDRSDDWLELLVAGPASPALLASCLSQPIPDEMLAHAAARCGEHTVWVRRVPFTRAPASVLACGRDAAAAIWQRLRAAGATPCGLAAYDAMRIEAGLPEYARDISDKNLPQEVGRDRQAISFTKGCYIGQETVARIDALGHVNQTLVGLRFAPGELPPDGTLLTCAQQAVGRVTSAALAPHRGQAIGLGYVRLSHAAPRTMLAAGALGAEVSALPFQ